MSKASINFRSDLHIMISFTDLEVRGLISGCKDHVALVILDQSTWTQKLAWSACETNKPPAQIFQGTLFEVHFITGSATDSVRRPLTGFRLHFSSHNSSTVLTQLPDGTWNCSVSHWPDFRLHFHCNLEVECSDGRDEVGCPYSGDLCKPGSFSAGGGCFVYVNPRKAVTWKEVRRECHGRGGHLASLTTVEVWNEVVEVLRTEWVHFILVGFEMASYTLPDVYHNLFQWDDGTMAYYFRMGNERTLQDQSGCGCLLAACNEIHLLLKHDCQRGLHLPFLCQIDEEKPTENQPSLLHSPQIALPGEIWVSHKLLVVGCPGNHVTHAFLACDDASSCWAKRTVSGRHTCTVPTKPHPPSFTCDNRVQKVPYSLVCDHRADCIDQSDESFCQFEPCQWFDFHCQGTQQCDDRKQCVNGNDEAECRGWREGRPQQSSPPALVQFDDSLHLNVTPLNTTSPLPGYPRPTSIHGCR
ncbi:hypothetical protein ACOMHN_037968 [Nucella lapillus]